jgi:GAF domain-containing protein
VLHLGRAPKHALVAPASVGGRVYGAIELVDPPSGQPFTESQEHALAYLAEQFAAFAAARGLLVREDDIRARRR